MGIIIKQGIKGSIISYVGILLGAFNVLWLYPMFLAPEEIGLMRLLQDIPFLFAVFVQLGASSINDRFHHYFKNDQPGNFFTLLMLYPLVGYLIFIGAFFGFHEYWESVFEAKSGLFIQYLIYLLPLTFFMMYTSIMESYLRSNLHVGWSNFARDILVRIFYTVFVSVYALKLISFDWLILLISLGYFISLITLFIHAKRNNLLHFTAKLKLPDGALLKEVKTYLFYLIPGTAGSLMAQKIDTIMLGTISGGKENEGLNNIAIYSLAYFIGSVVEVPRRSLSQISIPLLSKAISENDFRTAGDLYKKNSIVQLITGTFIFLLIWINIDDFYQFIPKSELYKQGKYVILFIGISKLFDMATSINGEIIQFSKYYRFNMIAILLLAFLTISFNYIFIPIYSINGAAIALAITVFFYNLAKTFFIYWKMNLSPFSKDMIPVFVCCLIVIASTLFVTQSPHTLLQSAFWILVRSGLFVLFFYFIIRKIRLSEDINQFIDKQLENISNKTGQDWIRKYL